MRIYLSSVVVFIQSIFFLILSEWIFNVTKPSFMSVLVFSEKLSVLFVSLGLFITAGFVLLSFLYLTLIKKTKYYVYTCSLLSSVLILILFFLLLDNFTYTVFSFGVVTLSYFTRSLYVFFLLIIFTKIYERVLSKILNNTPNVLLVLLMFIVSLVYFINNKEVLSSNRDFGTNQVDAILYPNIIIMTADGVNAENMSLYGYERLTTPNIDALAETSLVAENMYTNSANTTGSITSLFTGKYPMEVRVVYNPDILRDEDSYQHLLGLLKNKGYKSFQYSYVPYADTYSVNMVSGFDYANGRYAPVFNQSNYLSRLLDTDTNYFINEISSRISSRFLHILYIKEMDDNRDLVGGKVLKEDDWVKVDQLLDEVKASDGPVLGHIHWMGTHGARFKPSERKYSLGKDVDNQERWDTDFYDDAIMEFDMAVGKVVSDLKEVGEFNNTILIISSDHGQGYSTIERIPLVMHFPNNLYKQIVDNSQMIDVAPTLLDYLSLNIPDWIQGDSLFTDSLGERYILNTGLGNVDLEEGAMVMETIKPPFYQFGYIGTIFCDKWYRIKLPEGKQTSGVITSATNNCSNYPEDSFVYGYLKDKLKEFKFND